MLDGAVEHALLGVVSLEGVACVRGGVRPRRSRSGRAHPSERLPIPFRRHGPAKTRRAAAGAGIEAARSRFARSRSFTVSLTQIDGGGPAPAAA
jgi:hypothetical protein